METFTAYKAKQNLGALIDKALKSPVSITKHGRPVVVITSDEDYKELIRFKYERLKGDVQAGFEALEQGEYSAMSMDEIKAEARRRYDKKKNG